MRLLTLWPRLERGDSGTFGTNVKHVIWKPWFARVGVICCLGSWLQSLFSTLLQLAVRTQSLSGLWFASCSTFLSSWYAVSVSANPWNSALRFACHRIAVPACLFLRACAFPLESCFLWCSLSLLACWQDFPARCVDSGEFWAVYTTVLLSCPLTMFRNSFESFEDQVALGLCPW